MKNLKIKVTASLVAIFGIVALILSLWPTVESQEANQITLENMTRSLVVESVRESTSINNQREFEVTFRNDYDKAIASYCVQVYETQDGKTKSYVVERGGLILGWVLDPNQTKNEKFRSGAESDVVLRVAAVIFEDGTGDGDSEELSKLKDVRSGVRHGFQKIRPLFKKVADTPDVLRTENSLSDLAKKVRKLEDKDVPSNFRRGFALVKGYLATELNNLNDGRNRNSSAIDPVHEVGKKLVEIDVVLRKLMLDVPDDQQNGRGREN